jgi:hypothetical protein
MKTVHNRLTADVIDGATTSWTVYLEQGCMVSITPSFVMDPTARTGP